MLWVFCFRRDVKWKAASFVPVLICAGVTTIACAFEWLADRDITNWFQRIEWITYDWRVRMAANRSPVVATNLGLVALKDSSIEALLDNSLPYQFGLQWPRQVYARLVHELNVQGAKAIGFDIVFGELRPDHPPAIIDGTTIGSDEFLAQQMQRGSNVIVAAEKSIVPPDLFRTNAWATAEISAQREVDGILRRVKAFSVVTLWHPLLQRAKRDFGWKLNEARIERNEMVLPRDEVGQAKEDRLPLNEKHEFDAARLEAILNERPLPQGATRWEKPFTSERFWQLGLLLAAYDLRLDLSRAHVDLDRGRIEIPGQAGESRVIPIDRLGRFYIDWSLPPTDRRLTKEGIEDLLVQYELRRAGKMDEVTNRWAGKLIVVGSTATGNNLADLGATPLEHDTFLMSEHWNIANSVLTDRFIKPFSLQWRLALIIAFGMCAGLLTMKLPTLPAVGTVGLMAFGYIAAACWAFVTWRIWLPIVLPIGGALIVTHVCLITYLVRREQHERRHTKEIFSKIVSPDVVGELLEQEKLHLGGERRQLTVFFADARGFTEMTDEHQQRAGTTVMTRCLDNEKAKEIFDAEAADVLSSVNIYLGIAADCIKKHGGTLDKYIGDCVMAFWGAPIPNERHAVTCVRAVIDVQRAIFELNQRRREENNRIEEENFRRVLNAEAPLPLLDILTFGSGINTGFVTVGLMGSEEHLMNYTIFGREVNLASRLEGASGRGRILISEQTFREIERDDPDLAATCREQPLLELKGFRERVKAYEVPWHSQELLPVDAGQSQTIIRNKDLRKDCI